MNNNLNWFRDNPTYTIIGHTIVIATVTWGVMSFIVDESKVNNYKAQSETAKAQVDNERSIAEQYKVKVSVLEAELGELRKVNDRYLSWLLQEPKSFPAMERKISVLESGMKISGNVDAGQAASTSATEINKQGMPYEFSGHFLRGESLVDPKTKVAIGVSEIKPDYTVSGNVYLPDGRNIDVKDAKPGFGWEFQKDGIKYKVILNKVNWINNSLEASVVEKKPDIK